MIDFVLDSWNNHGLPMRERMPMREQRRIVLGAVRSQLRTMGIPIERSVVFEDVLKVLDELHRAEPELIASQWYASASEHQISLLRREWHRQFRNPSAQKRRRIGRM